MRKNLRVKKNNFRDIPLNNQKNSTDENLLLQKIRTPSTFCGNILKRALVGLLSATQILSPGLSSALHAAQLETITPEQFVFSQRPELQEFPSYFLDSGKDEYDGIYSLAFSQDLLEAHNKMSFRSKTGSEVAQISLVGNKVTLTAHEDLFLNSLNFKDFDLEIKSDKRITLLGDTVLNSLDVTASNLEMGSLTASNLRANLDQGFFSMGDVRLTGGQESLIKSVMGIEFQKTLTSIGGLSLDSQVVLSRSGIGVGSGPLCVNISKHFGNYGAIVAAEEIAFTGEGKVENKGKIFSGDALSFTGSKESAMHFLNHQGASITANAGSILGVNLSIDNQGEISANTEFDVLGGILSNTGKIISKGLMKSHEGTIMLESLNIVHQGDIQSSVGIGIDAQERMEGSGNVLTSGNLFLSTGDMNLSGRIWAGEEIELDALTAILSGIIEGEKSLKFSKRFTSIVNNGNISLKQGSITYDPRFVLSKFVNTKMIEAGNGINLHSWLESYVLPLTTFRPGEIIIDPNGRVINSPRSGVSVRVIKKNSDVRSSIAKSKSTLTNSGTIKAPNVKLMAATSVMKGAVKGDSSPKIRVFRPQYNKKQRDCKIRRLSVDQRSYS